MKICPKCNGNVLKCHRPIMFNGEQVDCGIWHEYKTIEPGVYTCECGYIFSITEDNYQEFEDKNK